MLDYVRFQLIATPMAALLKDRSPADRESVRSSPWQTMLHPGSNPACCKTASSRSLRSHTLR